MEGDRRVENEAPDQDDLEGILEAPTPSQTQVRVWKPNPGPQTRLLSMEIDEVLFGGSRGGGKGQALDAPILTPWGFRPMGSLKIGSAVCNPDGSIARVIGIYPLGVRQLYRVEFADKTSCEVTGDHIWLAWQSNRTRKRNGGKLTGERSAALWTTDAMIPLMGRRCRFMIPTTQAVTFNDAAKYPRRPVPPYALGALLGDGSMSEAAVMLSTADDAIATRVAAEVGGLTMSQTAGKCPSYRVSTSSRMFAYLRKAGLLGKDCFSKFIPQAYLLGSEEERWALLQGLMDTDGWADKDGDIYFTTTSERLRDDVAYLVRSLGGYVTTTEKHPTFTGTDGQKRLGATAWAHRIKLREPSMAFHLERKKALAHSPQSMGKVITSITPSRMAEAQCIQVSHPNGLYITNDFIVTHNTDAGIVWMALPALGPAASPRYRGLVIRRNATDLSDWIDRATMFYSPYGAKRRGNGSGTEFQFPNGAVIRCGHLKDESAYTRYQGHEYQRILVEELTHIARLEDYLKLLGSCRSTVPGLRPATLATSNPGGPGHQWVRRRFIKPAAPGTAFEDGETGRWRIYLPSKLDDNPHLDNADPGYRAFLTGLPDALRRAWLDGDWDALSGQYFPEFDRKAHVIRPLPSIPKHWEVGAGIDWGYSPDPWVCLWIAHDEDGGLIVYREASGNQQTPEEVSARIRDLSNGRRFTRAFGDPSMWANKDGTSTAHRMDIGGTDLWKANNDRVQGWLRIHEFLRVNPATGKPYLRIYDTCTNLIEAITTLQHSERVPEDAAPSEHDHWADALRYYAMSSPMPSERIKERPVPPDERTRLAWEHRDRAAKASKPVYDDPF